MPKKNNTSNIEAAYRGIKQLMLKQSLVPGQRMLYRELTARLNMSKTPIVNALNRLEQEGFVISQPNVGYAVKPVNEQEIQDAYEVREALEIKALEKAIETASPGDIARLKEKKEAFEHYQPHGYDKKKLMLDCEFHLQIAAMSGNEVLRYLLRRNFEHMILRTRLDHYPVQRMKDSALEHHTLYQGIKDRNFKACGRQLASHIQAAGRNVLACISHSETVEPDADSSFEFG